MLLLITSCDTSVVRNWLPGTADSDTLCFDTIPLPDTAFASVNDLEWEVLVSDSVTDGQLIHYSDLYTDSLSQLTFRGNLLRDADFGGTVKGTPSRVEKRWTFTTDFVGEWGGGSGWTGQPLYVEWGDSLASKFKSSPGAKLTADFDKREIIVGSLCCNVYFINFETGKASREPLPVGNPIKGTGSLDPLMNGNYYVGHGIPDNQPIGQTAFNLFTREQTLSTDMDSQAWRHWGAFDSSPVRVGQFLFWPGENGLIYKYGFDAQGKPVLHSRLRYKAKGDRAGGVENSICVYKNYGYFGDNRGDIVCINLNTMKPVWHYDNIDDIDGTIVCEVVEGVPYIYTACEVDQQGDEGFCQITKLNGLNGREEWAVKMPCVKFHQEKKHFDGGMYCTPLIGHGNCEGLIFLSLANDHGNATGNFYALDRSNGNVVWKTALRHYAWSSPVAFYNENNELFIFNADTAGTVYLFNGKTGEIIFSEHMGNNFESSPVVVGNSLVVGSRGQEIYKFEIL